MSEVRRTRASLAFLSFALAILADLEREGPHLLMVADLEREDNPVSPDIFSLRDIFHDADFPTETHAKMRADVKHPLVRTLGPQRLHVNMRADARRSPQVRRCNQRIR